MTWEEAEKRWPGCSAEWDVICMEHPADFPVILCTNADVYLWVIELLPTDDLEYAQRDGRGSFTVNSFSKNRNRAWWSFDGKFRFYGYDGLGDSTVREG